MSIWTKQPKLLKEIGLRIRDQRKKFYTTAEEASVNAGFKETNWYKIPFIAP
jgi:biotin operon repressor